MVYGHILTTYSIPQKENKCNHMITNDENEIAYWTIILKPENCPVEFAAVVPTTSMGG